MYYTGFVSKNHDEKAELVSNKLPWSWCVVCLWHCWDLGSKVTGTAWQLACSLVEICLATVTARISEHFVKWVSLVYLWALQAASPLFGVCKDISLSYKLNYVFSAATVTADISLPMLTCTNKLLKLLPQENCGAELSASPCLYL